MAKVSVIIPVYNGELYVAKTIESVFAQSFVDHEVIVVDDGSTDRTAEIVHQFGSRLKYLCQSNAGQASARNFGYQQSSGEYLAFLDADDLWYPEMLQVSVSILEEDLNVGLTYSDLDLIDTHGAVIQRDYLKTRSQRKTPKESFIGSHSIPFPSASVKRRSVFTAAGCFDTSFYQGGEDVLLWAKMYRLSKFAWIPQTLAQRRIHAQQVSHARQRRFEADLLVYQKLWEFLASDPAQQSNLLPSIARVWSREGQRLAKENKIAEARRCFGLSRRYDPLYWRNYLRLARSYF